MADEEWLSVLAVRDSLEQHPVGDFRSAAELLVRNIGSLVDATEGFVVLARQEPGAGAGAPLHGWQMVHYQTVCPDPEARDRIVAQWVAENHLDTDPVSEAVTAPGQADVRAYWLNEPGKFLEQKAAPDSLQSRTGHRDQVWGAARVAEVAEVWVGLARRDDEADFTAADRDMLSRALRACVAPLRRWGLLFGLFGASAPLTPRQRTVLAEILRGRSESEIADALGIARSTVHQVVHALYKSFGVQRRSELIVRWL